MHAALNTMCGCLTAFPGLKPYVSCPTSTKLDIHFEPGHSYTHITAMPSGSQSSQSQTQYSPQSSPSKPQQPIVHAGGRNAQGQIVCKHDLPAKELTVVKDTPNKGKVRCFAILNLQTLTDPPVQKFYVCPIPADCKYWSFADRVQSLRGGSPSKSQPTPSTSKIIPSSGFQPKSTPAKNTFASRQKTPDQYDQYLDDAISSSPSPSKRQPDIFDDEIVDDEPEVKRQKFSGFAVTPSSSPTKSPSTAKVSPMKTEDGVLGTIGELGKVLGGRVDEVVEELRREMSKQARMATAATKSKEYKDRLIQELRNEVDVLRSKNASLEAELEGYRNA